MLMTCLSSPIGALYLLECKQISLGVKEKSSLHLLPWKTNQFFHKKKKKKHDKYSGISPYAKISCKCFWSRNSMYAGIQEIPGKIPSNTRKARQKNIRHFQTGSFRFFFEKWKILQIYKASQMLDEQEEC